MFKRSVAILASTAVLAVLAAPPAPAADPHPEPYGAGVSATALYLRLADQELTFSATSAAVGSEPGAKADGRAAVTPAYESPGAAVESSDGLVTGDDCAADEHLPAPVDLASALVVCVATRADVAAGSPEASAVSDEVELDVLSAEALGTLSETVLRPLLTQLLASLTGPDGLLADLDAGPSLDTLVTLLLNDLEDGGALASVTVAPASSTATDVESVATAQGAHIDVLPGLLPGIGPLASVTVGDSMATAAYNPETGKVDIDGRAAYVDADLTGLELVLTALLAQVDDTVVTQLPEPLDEATQDVVAQIGTLATGLDEQVEEAVNVPVDQLACPDSPLAALLCFEAGGVHELDAAGLERFGFTYGEGTRGIQAEILGLSVLDGLLELGVGQASAGANAVLAQAPPAGADPGPLPRTGGGTSLPVAIGLLVAAIAGLTVLRRTRPA